MAYDDDIETDDLDDEGVDDDQDDSQDQQNDGDAEGQPFSAEEREAIRMLRETGMTPQEAVSRARRDYEAEYYGGQRYAPAPPAQTPQSSPNTEKDGDELLTRAEADAMMRRAQAEARHQAMMDEQHRAARRSIADQIKERLGDVPAWKKKHLENEVGTRMGKNVKLLRMDDDEFGKEIERITQAVIEDEVKLARGLRQMTDKQKLEERLEAHKTAVDAGGRPSPGSRRSTMPSERTPNLREKLDNPRFGIGTTWPSEAEIQQAHEEDLEEFRKKAKSA